MELICGVGFKDYSWFWENPAIFRPIYVVIRNGTGVVFALFCLELWRNVIADNGQKVSGSFPWSCVIELVLRIVVWFVVIRIVADG